MLLFPVARPRRLRRTPALRALVAETSLRPAELVLPVFIKEGLVRAAADLLDARRGPAHPGQPAQGRGRGGRGGRGRADRVRRARGQGRRGSAADDPAGISQLALSDLRAEVGDACVIMADLCLCEYTDHGHCGVLTAGRQVANDATLERYAAIAVAQAEAGAHMVAPSGMMDGQVAAIRAALDAAGHDEVGDLRLLGQVRVRLLRPVPRGRRGRAAFGDRPATSRTRPTRPRPCARWRWTSTRAPTW